MIGKSDFSKIRDHVKIQHHVLRQVWTKDWMDRPGVFEIDQKPRARITRQVLQMQMQQVHVRHDVFL